VKGLMRDRAGGGGPDHPAAAPVNTSLAFHSRYRECHRRSTEEKESTGRLPESRLGQALASPNPQKTA
jgi:hypothetical protein